LANLASNDPRIAYNPSSAAVGVTGSLTCNVSASPGSQANYPQPFRQPWYDFHSCRGLSDPGRTLSYDYVNSKYYIHPAPVSLAYTGPAVIAHEKPVTLSAKLLNEASGRPVPGRVLNFQINGNPSVGCESTSPRGTWTNVQGVGSCRISHVTTKISSTTVSVLYTGDGDRLPGRTTFAITIVK